MKAKSLLVVGAGAGILYYLGTKVYNTTQAINKLSIQSVKFKIAPGTKILNVVADITLQVLNPSSVNLPFDYYAGTIAYDGSKLADFNYNGNGQNIQLKARSVTPITVQLNITTVSAVLKLAKVIKALINKTPIDTKFIIQSALYAGGIDVPVNFVYDVRTQSTINGIGKIKFLKKFREKVLSKTPVALAVKAIKRKRGKGQPVMQVQQNYATPVPVMEAQAATITPTALHTPTAAPAPVQTQTVNDMQTVAPSIPPHVDEPSQNWGGN